MAVHEILDSRFRVNRTCLRTWRELRYIGLPMWSKAEEEALRRECLTLLDGEISWVPPSVSNATLWAASFDRYGVPLSDLFTYGLKLHRSSTRGARAKYIAPMCCQLLILIFVHPIFQSKIHLVRCILQNIICLRMGIHQPPVGPAAEIEDSANPTLDDIAEVLYNEDQMMGQTESYHSALWLYMQEYGFQTHPEIVNLVDTIRVAFKNGKAFNVDNIPSDNTPDCRNLFFLQLWDLQFLVQVLNNMASSQGYLPVEAYHKQWLVVTRRVRPYIEAKIDDLVESWYLHDERNDRVRQKLIAKRSGRPIFDIAEEDFRPLYAKSGLITVGMRSILCGDYLKSLCPFGSVDVMDVEMQDDVTVNGQEDIKVNEMQEDDTVNMMHEDDMVNEMRDDDTVSEQDDITINHMQDDGMDNEMQGIEMQNTNNGIDPEETDDDLELQGTYNNIVMQGINDRHQPPVEAPAGDHDDTEVESTADDPAILPGTAQDFDDTDEYEPSISGEHDDNEYEAVRARPARRRRRRVTSSGSIASFHSIHSSNADEWEPVDDQPAKPQNEHIARRGLPEQAGHKPAFRRRRDFD